MNRNTRREAHYLKRAGGVLGRVASGNHLAAQNDEPEPLSEEDRRLASMFDGPLEGEEPQHSASERAERFHRDNDRRALEQQVQDNLRDPLTRGCY